MEPDSIGGYNTVEYVGISESNQFLKLAGKLQISR
jgi:hypothetical protein